MTQVVANTSFGGGRSKYMESEELLSRSHGAAFFGLITHMVINCFGMEAEAFYNPVLEGTDKEKVEVISNV